MSTDSDAKDTAARESLKREIEAEARVLTGVARSGLEEKPRMWDTRFAEGGGHNLGAGHGFLRRVAQGAAACSR